MKGHSRTLAVWFGADAKQGIRHFDGAHLFILLLFPFAVETVVMMIVGKEQMDQQ